ncbi:MAG: hypothetical protein RIF36_11125 [Imperialibacter sp.]
MKSIIAMFLEKVLVGRRIIKIATEFRHQTNDNGERSVRRSWSA